jgi:hypothetical protein
MSLDVFEAILSFVCLAATLAFIVRIRRRKFVFITDYQAGVRFRDGAFDRIMPPGGHLTRIGASEITTVDLRPRQFVFERFFYQDILRARSVISVGGEIVVRNPQLAISTLKDLANDPLQIVREHLSPAASRTITDPTPEGRKKLADLITTELNRELETRGVEVRNLEITELWAQPIQHSIPAIAN